jgi:hypothetical protein
MNQQNNFHDFYLYASLGDEEDDGLSFGDEPNFDDDDEDDLDYDYDDEDEDDDYDFI